MAEFTGETELTWSPFATTAPHFRTIQWKKRISSPKATSFKIPSPQKWKCVLPDGHQLHGCQIHVIWWIWHTLNTPIPITSIITPVALLTQVTIIFFSTIKRIISWALLRGLFTYRQKETPVWTRKLPWWVRVFLMHFHTFSKNVCILCKLDGKCVHFHENAQNQVFWFFTLCTQITPFKTIWPNFIIVYPIESFQDHLT